MKTGTSIQARHFRYLIYFIFMVFNLHATAAAAQKFSATATVKQKDYVVGDIIHVNLIVERPDNFTVTWRRQVPDPNKLELADSIVKDSAKENGNVKIDILLPLSGYDSGLAVYPAQIFVFKKNGDTAHFTVKTDSIIFRISPINVDMSKDIKPIASPVEPGLDWWTIIRIIIGLWILMLMIAIALIYFRKHGRKRSHEPLPPTEIQRPAWEIAIEQLALLQKDDLPARNEIKQFYIRLSDIVRHLASAVTGIDALELSTSEFLQELKWKAIDIEGIDKLRAILSLADSVKFARYKPNPEDHEKAMQQSIQFADGLRNTQHDQPV